MRLVIVGTYPLDKTTIRGGVEAVLVNLVEGLKKKRSLDIHIISCRRELTKAKIVKCELRAEYEEELMGQVILRIIISIKKMTGGRFGAYGYLNYLKNNLHPSYIEDPDSHTVELKDGRKYDYKPT